MVVRRVPATGLSVENLHCAGKLSCDDTEGCHVVCRGEP